MAIETGTETVPLRSDRAAIADGLNMASRALPPALAFGVEWITNEGAPWVRITMGESTFGTWPETIAVHVAQALGYSHMVAGSHVAKWQKPTA